MVTLMQLIKRVLDDLYARIAIQDEAEKDAAIKEELETISNAYRNVEHASEGTLDYGDPIKRFAYIYKYTVAHADYIMQLVDETDELGTLFEKEEIEVACLGGGPGSDLIGILKYILNKNCKTLLTCYLFDRERAWSDSWVHVARRMNAPCTVYPVFNHMDVTDQKTWAAYESYFNSDIITLSYFLSEVYRHRTDAEPFFEHVFMRAKHGAIFLYIDNSSSKFTDWFDRMARRAGLEAISQGRRTIAFSNDEEKTDLGPYLAKFDWPKRKADVDFRIMRKP